MRGFYPNPSQNFPWLPNSPPRSSRTSDQEFPLLLRWLRVNLPDFPSPAPHSFFPSNSPPGSALEAAHEALGAQPGGGLVLGPQRGRLFLHPGTRPQEPPTFKLPQASMGFIPWVWLLHPTLIPPPSHLHPILIPPSSHLDPILIPPPSHLHPTFSPQCAPMLPQR